jgi:hypothetical protein
VPAHVAPLKACLPNCSSWYCRCDSNLDPFDPVEVDLVVPAILAAIEGGETTRDVRNARGLLAETV